MSFCEHCGKPLSPQANFCGNCGQKITSKTSGRKNPEPSDTSSVPAKGKQKRVSEKPTDEAIPTVATSTHSGMLFYPISAVLIFFTTAIPVYVLTHPGLLYYPSVTWPKYKHVGDVWPGVFILIVANTVFALLYRTKTLFLISAALSIAYIVGLYYFPINYFLFREDFSHAVNDESLAYSLLLIAFNAYVFVKSLIDWYQHRLSSK